MEIAAIAQHVRERHGFAKALGLEFRGPGRPAQFIWAVSDRQLLRAPKAVGHRLCLAEVRHEGYHLGFGSNATLAECRRIAWD